MTNQYRGLTRRRLRKGLDESKDIIEHEKLLEKFKDKVVFYHWNKLEKVKDIDYLIIHIKFSRKINFNEFRNDFLERMRDYVNGENQRES